MNPPELNAMITAITNHLYCTLPRDEFINVGIFLSLLSKDIISMATIEGLCKLEQREQHKEQHKEHHREQHKN